MTTPDTSRCDKQKHYYTENDDDGKCPLVDLDFAQDLERSLTQANTEIERLKDANEALVNAIDAIHSALNSDYMDDAVEIHKIVNAALDKNRETLV